MRANSSRRTFHKTARRVREQARNGESQQTRIEIVAKNRVQVYWLDNNGREEANGDSGSLERRRENERELLEHSSESKRRRSFLSSKNENTIIYSIKIKYKNKSTKFKCN